MSMPTHPEVVTLDPASNDDALRLAAAIRSVCDIDGRWDAAEILQALAAPPLPEEPPEWSVVRANHVTLVRMDPGTILRPRDYRWWRIGTEEVARTWPEVCALGTPGVLEPDSVKALREQVTNLAAEGVVAEAERDEARATVAEVVDFVKLYDPSDPQDTPPWALLNSIGRTVGLGPVCSPGAKDYIAPAAEDDPAEPAPVEVTEEPADLSLAVRGSAGTVWEQRRSRHMPDLFFWYDGQRAYDAGDGRSWSYLLAHHGPLTLVETGGQS